MMSRQLKKLLMDVILKNKKLSFLLCLKSVIRYYEKFGWKKMNSKKFLIKDHNFYSYGMCFNNKDLNKKFNYIFYLHR